jgi:hypothetical protein
LLNFETCSRIKKMAHFKDKLQVFFLGLLLGLVLGGSFFVFKLDEYVKELSIYKSLTHSTPATEEKSTEKEDPNVGKVASKTKTAANSTSNAIQNTKTDSSTTLKTAQNSGHIQTDSLQAKDSLTASVETEDIVIHKDQLVNTENIEVINTNPVASNTGNTKDSLAAKMAGVRDEHVAGRQFCSVEFWVSPLNYKGYKMNRNKIILYGFADPENTRLFKLDEEIYLHSSSGVYRLDYTSDFRPYERVTNEAILAKLK